MLGPVMFDLFIKVYFIDRKLIATSECHFDDNLNFMQTASAGKEKQIIFLSYYRLQSYHFTLKSNEKFLF